MPHAFAFYTDGNSVFMAGEDFVRKPDETILRPVDVCGAVHAQSGVAVAAFSVRKTESRTGFDFRRCRILKAGPVNQFFLFSQRPVKNVFRSQTGMQVSAECGSADCGGCNDSFHEKLLMLFP